MSDTYCGNNCNTCSYKSELDCKGCKEGPGRVFYGKCEIARCCRKNNCISCFKCGKKCEISMTRKEMPKLWKKELDEEKQAISAELEKTDNAFFVLRGIILPLMIFEFLSSTFFTEALYYLKSYCSLPGIITEILECLDDEMFTGAASILRYLCVIIYYVSLINLRNKDPRYIKAGICGIIYGLTIRWNIIQTYRSVNNYTLTFLLCITSTIIGIAGLYFECCAHRDLFFFVDKGLSENWENYMKYEVALMVLLVVCKNQLFYGYSETVIFIWSVLYEIALVFVFTAKFRLLYKSRKSVPGTL